MNVRRRRWAAFSIAVIAWFSTGFASALGAGVPVSPTQAQVWVAGRQITFDHLAIAYGDPITPADDPGLQAMLAAVAARSSWQPGTGFVAITRGDGKLVTFTLGSNAVSVDGAPASMPFAPFTAGDKLYLPLLPLARALDLGVRGFHAGYVFVPQIVSVTPSYEGRRLVVRVVGSAPLTWHSALTGPRGHQQLALSFAGFGTDATGAKPIRSAVSSGTNVAESGPPGFPTTTVTIALKAGAKYAARHGASGSEVDVVLARDEWLLRAGRPSATPPSVRVGVTPLATPPARDVRVTPPATPVPSTAAPASSSPPSASPAAAPSAVATAIPLGPGESPGPSAEPSAPVSPSAPMVEQKITDVSVAEAPTGTRITLTLTGPVSFEWHRLADPDNRYWLDIDRAMLVGPAQTLTSKLAFIKEVKVSQHALAPDKVVRVSIEPTQAIDVRVGTVAGAPNQLGIEIENQPPAPDAAMSGFGNTVAAFSSPTPSTSAPAVPAQTRSNLIVIDPGHGGSDPGSLNPAYGLKEADLTLAISRRLAADLKRQGWQVELTRDGDYDVGDPTGPDSEELQARCDIANAAGARLFVSVHINSSVSSAPNGSTTYYWHPQDRAFADAVQNELLAAAGLTDDGVIRNNFYVIHHTVMTSILVEVAYLSNPHDATLLSQASFLDKLAAGIARGIGDYTGGPGSPVGQSGSKPLGSRAPARPPHR